MKQSRNYCFTQFDMTFDVESIYLQNKDVIRYICAGEEIAPKTGKKHLQGWIQFFNKKRLGGVKKILNDKKIHLESCRGDEYSNNTYCAKDGKFRSFGKFVCQGQRTDLEAIKKLIKDGASRLEVMESHFECYCRYRNGINDYIEETQKASQKAFRDVNVEVYWGDTGTGKTRKACEENPNAFKISGWDLKWFDGYCGEKTLIIDEYNNDINITKMLGILDGYKLRLPIKGGFTFANWEKIIITSNIDPEDWHPVAKYEHRQALFRRIKSRVKFINL